MPNILTKLFFKKDAKHHIKAVHDNDLEKYLKSIGIYDKIVSGKIKCKFCGTTINLGMLEAIVPDNGKISVVCQNKKCLNQV